MSAPSAASSSCEASTATGPGGAQLRRGWIGWAVGGGLSAWIFGVPWGLEAALRAGGCGVFYGLLAFHLQRADPDDSHLQAGLVGAVCGIHSLALPPLSPWPLPQPWLPALAQVGPPVMMELVRAWLPLIGAALVLHGSQVLPPVFAARAPVLPPP